MRRWCKAEIELMPNLATHQARMAELIDAAPIIPVVTVHSQEQGINLAGVLADCGLHTVEVTLRTQGALDALKAIHDALPQLTLGAGTVLTETQMQAAKETGCRFAVSPGSTDRIITASLNADLPLLPGAASPSETQALLERGIRIQKFFPAEERGGLAYLMAIYGPYPDARFCPTSGINANNASTYLAQPNVACVGGSWMAPSASVHAGDWTNIACLAKAAARIGSDARTVTT